MLKPTFSWSNNLHQSHTQDESIADAVDLMLLYLNGQNVMLLILLIVLTWSCANLLVHPGVSQYTIWSRSSLVSSRSEISLHNTRVSYEQRKALTMEQSKVKEKKQIQTYKQIPSFLQLPVKVHQATYYSFQEIEQHQRLYILLRHWTCLQDWKLHIHHFENTLE